MIIGDETRLAKSWHTRLSQTFPDRSQELNVFFADSDKGFHHSFEVLTKSVDLCDRLVAHNKTTPNMVAVEHLAVFHDIGKFFQKVQSFDNLRVSQQLYSDFAAHTHVPTETAKIVLDGIPATDFYCARLNPNEQAPQFVEGEIVRASDKMLDNLVRKVDRYWFEYGVPRGATFFDPKLSNDERKLFNFGNFSGDQLNVILTIIALRSTDFGHPLLGQIYCEWAKDRKDAVVRRILDVAAIVDPQNTAAVANVIEWYRNEFSC